MSGTGWLVFLGTGRGFLGAVGPPAPQSWSRPRPLPPPRRPPSVSDTLHAPAGPAPPGLSSPPPPVDTEEARVRYFGVSAHPILFWSLLPPQGSRASRPALSQGQSSFKTLIPLAPKLNSRIPLLNQFHHLPDECCSAPLSLKILPRTPP